jgi:hypothetical protein
LHYWHWWLSLMTLSGRQGHMVHFCVYSTSVMGVVHMMLFHELLHWFTGYFRTLTYVNSWNGIAWLSSKPVHMPQVWFCSHVMWTDISQRPPRRPHHKARQVVRHNKAQHQSHICTKKDSTPHGPTTVTQIPQKTAHHKARQQ